MVGPNWRRSLENTCYVVGLIYRANSEGAMGLIIHTHGCFPHLPPYHPHHLLLETDAQGTVQYPYAAAAILRMGTPWAQRGPAYATIVRENVMLLEVLVLSHRVVGTIVVRMPLPQRALMRRRRGCLCASSCGWAPRRVVLAEALQQAPQSRLEQMIVDMEAHVTSVPLRGPAGPWRDARPGTLPKALAPSPS